MTETEEVKRISDELSALYGKAKTKEEYLKVVELGKLYANTLKANLATPNTVVSTVLSSCWAGYYLLLKFPAEVTEEDKDDFMERIDKLELQTKDPSVKAELLYLESVAWSHLMDNQENADWCNEEFKKLVSEGKVLITQVLKGINSRAIKEMDAKNWQGAIKIADEIKQFSKETMEQPENIGAAANIINNRGASKVRGDIDIKDGIKDLVTALDYYLKQPSVPMKHIEGIRNRLMEAIKKL
ncbi:MAG: hypothetical protein Q8N37_03550 [bacterium]|nr:hypothetical protein [bacterium]